VRAAYRDVGTRVANVAKGQTLIEAYNNFASTSARGPAVFTTQTAQNYNWQYSAREGVSHQQRAERYFEQLVQDIVDSGDEVKAERLMLFATGRRTFNPNKPIVLELHAQRVARGSSSRPLPRAHTCFNTIDVPSYLVERSNSYAQFKERFELAYANAGDPNAGFDFA
jgi:hypothetical protein